MPTLGLVPDPPDGRRPVTRIPRRTGSPHPSAGPVVDAPVRWFDTARYGATADLRAHVLFTLNVWAVDSDTIADAVVLVCELVVGMRRVAATDRVGVRASLRRDRVVVSVVEPPPASVPRAIGVPEIDEVRLTDDDHSARILDAMASEWGFVRVDGVATGWFSLPLR